jgi:hypothetical protein
MLDRQPESYKQELQTATNKWPESYKQVADLAGRSAPCETQHSLLVSELLLLESQPNRQYCRRRPPTLDRRGRSRRAQRPMRDMTLVAGFWIAIAFNVSNMLY